MCPSAASWCGPAALALALVFCGLAPRAEARQLSSLVSPGALSKAHASINGVSNCTQCHETGRKVTAAKCLTCHKPIAERIEKHKGVHRDAASGCTTCHTEHAGEATDLRRLNRQTFDHARETGFALDGVHQATAPKCEACHKTRSFLTAKPSCASCHADPHRGSIGPACETCHSTKAPFAAARSTFDHAKARFPLTGAHQSVKCESCHKTTVFRPTAFSTCSSCHADPHENKFRAACSTCHTPERWTTRSVEHARTGFPLNGAHARVACASCHVSGRMTTPVRHDTCSTCHTDVHRGSVKGDCKTCHTETSFKPAPFDHLARTGLALDGKHIGVACAKCHTTASADSVPLAQRVVDFSGADRRCVTCHRSVDPHKGDFGQACDSCHKTATFDVKAFTHAGLPDFYDGAHRPVSCDKCHVPPRRPTATGPDYPTTACSLCHRDVHFGQVGAACESCHRVDSAAFKAVAFSHGRAAFPLTGKHAEIECAKCHKTEARAFPAGDGSAMVLKPIDTQCRACHQDVHLGQLNRDCQSCHTTTAFKIAAFAHKGLEDFFAGFHGKYGCDACHKPALADFPRGRGVATRYLVGRACLNCHAR